MRSIRSGQKFHRSVIMAVLWTVLWTLMLAAPRPTLAATPVPMPPCVSQGRTVTVAQNIPYLWLRRQPSSTADVILTVHPGEIFAMRDGTGDSSWDGVQSWARVSVLSTTGWVESARIEAVPCTKDLASPDGQRHWPMECSTTRLDTLCAILFPNGQRSPEFGWAIEWSADNQYLLVPDDGTHDSFPGSFEVWDMAAGIKTAVIDAPDHLLWKSWAPTGHVFAYIRVVDKLAIQLTLLDAAAGQQQITRQCPDWVIEQTGHGRSLTDPHHRLGWNHELCDNWTPAD